MIATIQIFIDGKWITAGTFEPVERDIAKGIGGRGLFEYDANYVLSHLDDVSACRVGLRYPVNFELYKSDGWPAFLLDILPSGAGRRVWVHRLGLKNNEAADWQLLLNGAGNPPGNRMHRRQGHFSSAILKRWGNSPTSCGNAGWKMK